MRTEAPCLKGGLKDSCTMCCWSMEQEGEGEDWVLVLEGAGQGQLQLLLLYLYTGSVEVGAEAREGLLDLLVMCQVPVPQESEVGSFDMKAEEIAVEDVLEEQSLESSEEIVSETMFKCDICDNGFLARASLEEHVQSEHDGYICDLCNKILESYEGLLQHKATHRAAKNFKCVKCGKLFRWRAEYRRHAETSHGQKITDMTTCNVCNKQVVLKRLNKHIKMVHGNSKPFSCKQCIKKFAKPSELKNHQRIHSGERPFECDICHASFSYSHILSRHKKYHEGSKKFSCKDCGKSFLQKNDLVKHMRIHSGEKPYKCDLCSKSFARMDYLKKHNMLHLSDNKFCCTECGELCGSVDGLKKHKKQHHSNTAKLENPGIELNSFEDLALQLPHLSTIGGDNVLESISELQAVSLDGGKTIMIPVCMKIRICHHQKIYFGKSRKYFVFSKKNIKAYKYPL